jgi:hypothetical protein
MTSEYFDAPTHHLTPGSRARAADINTALDAIDTGLAKLPTEAQLKRGTINYAADTGAANAIVVTLPHAPAGYEDNQEISFKAAATNTGAATINVNGLGVKSLRRQDGSALVAGDITANSLITARYNSTSGNVEISAGLISVAGTMGLQNANAVAITGGTAAGLALTNGTLNGTTFADILTALIEVGYSVISANTDAVSFGKYLCDTSAGAFTLTLPAAPGVGDIIWIADAARTFFTNNLTVGRNGLKIHEAEEDFTVDENGAYFALTYSGPTYGWGFAA